MPLIRRPDASKPAAPAAQTDARARLANGDVQARWSAARELAEDSEAVGVLADAVLRETSPQVSEAIFTSLMLIRTPSSGQALANLVRLDDASIRSGALDALAGMPDIVEGLLPTLLTDADRDMRILSCDLARTLPQQTALRQLNIVLIEDADPSVCGAAVEVLADIGGPEAISALKACKARFPDEAFLGFAIDDAVDRASAGRLDRNE